MIDKDLKTLEAFPNLTALYDRVRALPQIDAWIQKWADLYPNQLCDYLFETSQKFNQFYEQCSVKNAETDELRASRAALCAVTANLLQVALGLLGIGVVDRI